MAAAAAKSTAGHSSEVLAGASTGPSLPQRQQQDLKKEAELARRTVAHPPHSLAEQEPASTLPPGPEGGGVQQSPTASTRRFAGLPVSAGGVEADREAGAVSESAGMALPRHGMQRLMEFMSNVPARVSGLETRSAQAAYSAGPGPEGASLMIGLVPHGGLLPGSVGGGVVLVAACKWLGMLAPKLCCGRSGSTGSCGVSMDGG